MKRLLAIALILILTLFLFQPSQAQACDYYFYGFPANVVAVDQFYGGPAPIVVQYRSPYQVPITIIQDNRFHHRDFRHQNRRFNDTEGFLGFARARAAVRGFFNP
jgi:hypothetical protein